MGSPVCWALRSKGTPNTRRPFTSIGLVFLGGLGTVLQARERPLLDREIYKNRRQVMEMNVYSEIILQAFQECVISTSRVFGGGKGSLEVFPFEGRAK